MKKTYLLLSAVAASMILASCGEHQHIDKNHDGICDECGAKGMVFEHIDNNKDHKCDECGQTMSEHEDKNHDDKCDICGADMSSGGSGSGTGEGGEEDIHIDPMDVPTVFESCMNYDYSNMTVGVEVCTGYSATYEGYEANGYYAEEYYLGGGKYIVFDESTYETYLGSGYPMDYWMYKYADFEGVNYKWTKGEWADEDNKGHPYQGYIREYTDHMIVGLDRTWFYMDNLINNLTMDDVIYSAGTYVIKPTSMDKINETALYFTVWDNLECKVSGLDVGMDAKGNYYFKNFKSYVNPENDRSPYAVITFNKIGTTTVPAGSSEVPDINASNTFADYYEMSGEPRPIQIYIDELDMQVQANIKYFMEDEEFNTFAGKSYQEALEAGEYTDDASTIDSNMVYVYNYGHYYETNVPYVANPAYADYDLVIREGETVDVSLFIGPENWNREGLTEWRYTGDTAVENYKEENGCYPASGFYGIFSYNDTPSLKEATDELRHVHRHKWFTGVHAGECEIWATHWAPYQEEVQSEKLKVLILPPQGESQDQETASYAFSFTNANKMLNDPNDSQSGYWHTEFAAANIGNKSAFNNPEYEIVGMRTKLLEAQYTEAFNDRGNEQLLFFGVGDQDEYQSCKSNYVLFDLKDQEVSSMSCKFSLHVSNHLSNLENLKSAYIYTSNDGVTWDSYNLKNKLINHWSQLSSSGYMDAFLYERNFTNNARYVKFEFEGNQIGKMLGIVVADVKFYSDETCATHVVKPVVDVTGLTVNCENSVTMSAGTTMVVTPTVAPENATNKKVIFTSANPKVASVNQYGEIVAKAKGTTTITVYTDYMNGDGEHFEKVINITVGDKPTINPSAEGTFKDANRNMVKVDTSKSIVTVSILKDDVDLMFENFNLYDIKDGEYFFVSADGTMKMTAEFNEEFTSIVVKTITIGTVVNDINITLTK